MTAGVGMTWEYVDECMTMPRYQKLARYWQAVPPPAEALTAILGAFGHDVEVPKSLEPGADDGQPGTLGDDGMRHYSPDEVAAIFGAAGFSVH